MAAAAQEYNISQEFEEELKAKNENVHSIECMFTQTRESSVLADVVKKEGTFSFLRPVNMLLNFNDGDFIRMNGKMFEMKSAGQVTATKISSSPMLKSLNSILSACVVGDFKQMARGFAVEVEKNECEWVLVLTPKRGKAASKISNIAIHFDREDMSLNVLKMVEKSGDYTMYEFMQKRFNAPVDEQLFNISK